MKKQNYFIGLDIGTDSVGYAVTDEQYNLCKFGGEPMWGTTLFDSAGTAVERRGFRTARRRLDRRQQRVNLLTELFAPDIAKTDENFFKRIKESYLYPETDRDKVRIFDSYEKQKAYVSEYPTIHHLIVELMNSSEPHDVRLVYLACAWLVAHRGHFLSEVDKNNVAAVTDFRVVYDELVKFITRDGLALPWKEDADLDKVQDILKSKSGITKKAKALNEALFRTGKAPKELNEEYEYNYDLVIKLLCGGKVSLKELYGKEEYAELEEKSVSLNMEDEKLSAVMASIDDDADLLVTLKAVYDWSVLVDILKGKRTVSEAKVEVYAQHKRDLRELKYFVKKYLPEKYSEVFRSDKQKNNYASYIGKNTTANKKRKPDKLKSQEDLCKYLLSVVKAIKPDETDQEGFEKMLSHIENVDFLPKQVNGDNRVIPYQLYWFELKKILENAENYIPFLREADGDGTTGAEKILSVFEFRVPYYVGPLKEKSTKYNHWMVRRAEGKIYPWNFEEKVDLDQSENEFIRRMTNSCTYLPGEDVLPKNSLIYSAFEVLNEINNIKVNGLDIPVGVKQGVYRDVFMKYPKVTVKKIKEYLVSNNYIKESDELGGIDITVKSTLKSFLQFDRLIGSGQLGYSDVENIIGRATYSEDKTRFSKWLNREYPHLPQEEAKYIAGLKFKDFGRLSEKLLCGMEGVNKETGETFTLIRALWETNCNLMQLLSDKFTFKEKIDEFASAYYGKEPKSISAQLDEMYISNAVKRPIIRTVDILKDIVKVQGGVPERIFIEMARGASEDQRGKRTKSRLAQIRELYEKVDKEEVRVLNEYLDSQSDIENKLQSDKLFLYFIQLGKCLYSGERMDIQSVISGDGSYNIEHIYPRSFVKDDSVINNEILVKSQMNGDKSDKYPIDPAIQGKMRTFWMRLNNIGLLSDEKYRRLTRTTRFTDDEKFEFINRQLVETRQSTKAVATLLKKLYPETEIVYVKAGLVSEFRQQYGLLKSRQVNDLHHAKDAYLNIVAGNVWYSKYSRQFWRKDADNNAKIETVFARPVVCNGKTVWNGAIDKDRVVRIAKKNTAHLTKYSYCKQGGFFDQMPLKAAPRLVPLKKDRPTEIYGGYNKPAASFFALVRYKAEKKQDVMFMPVELLFADRFITDDAFATDYAKRAIKSIANKSPETLEFLFNKRIIKVNTVLSLNGFRVCITGKSGGGRQIGVSALTAFKTSYDNELYIKRLESFEAKRKKNDKIVFNEKYDGISPEKNLSLYDCYIEKLQNAPFKYRPNNPCDILLTGRDKFVLLSPDEQATVLLSIQGLFGRMKTANFTKIGSVPSAGVAALSSSLSNWKKYYTDVRIIDQSASGLFETVSENLLDLL